MSEKRRDSKNRILQPGESQRPDGRYQYKYTDALGETKFAYSWKLVPTDKIPAGKRPDISLREKIKQIQKDLDDGIDTIGKKMTVCQLYSKYIHFHIRDNFLNHIQYNYPHGIYYTFHFGDNIHQHIVDILAFHFLCDIWLLLLFYMLH